MPVLKGRGTSSEELTAFPERRIFLPKLNASLVNKPPGNGKTHNGITNVPISQLNSKTSIKCLLPNRQISQQSSSFIRKLNFFYFQLSLGEERYLKCKI